MMARNDALKLDTFTIAQSLVFTPAMRLGGWDPTAWDDAEYELTDSAIMEFNRIVLTEYKPLLQQASREFVGARYARAHQAS